MTASPVTRRTAPRLVAGLAVALGLLASACMPADPDPTPGETTTTTSWESETTSVTVTPTETEEPTVVEIERRNWPLLDPLSANEFADSDDLRPMWGQIAWEDLLIPSDAPLILLRTDVDGQTEERNTYELDHEAEVAAGLVQPGAQMDPPADGLLWDYRESNTTEVPYELPLYSVDDPTTPLYILVFTDPEEFE